MYLFAIRPRLHARELSFMPMSILRKRILTCNWMDDSKKRANPGTYGKKGKAAMTDWKAFCRGVPEMRIEGEAVVVDLDFGRGHRVEVHPTNEGVELSGVVARGAAVETSENVALAAWERNRAVSVVGFRFDGRGRLVGEACAPFAGLTKDEFLFYVRSTAVACDLFEFQLTGKDRA